MANIQIVGFFRSSRIINNNNSILVAIDEYSPPYTHTRTGQKVDAKMIRWYVIFDKYFIKFIRSNFKNGNIVEIFGKAKPFADSIKDNNDNIVKIGVHGTTIAMHCNLVDLSKDEKRLKTSERNNEHTPDLDSYLQDDF